MLSESYTELLMDYLDNIDLHPNTIFPYSALIWDYAR